MNRHAPFRFIIFILFLAVIFVGCNNDSNPPVIMPLKIGNQWTYENTLFATNIYPIMRDTLITKIVGDTIYQNEEWFKTSDNWYYSNRSNGAFLTFLPYKPSLIAKYPCFVGDTFYCEGYNTFKKVISTNGVVATSLGSFICIQYRHTGIDLSSNTSWYIDEFYCPNYGLIREDYYHMNASGQYVLDDQRVLIGMILK